MILQSVLDVLLGITPVPGLSAAFNILKLIVSAVQQASKSKQRLAVLAQSVAQLLQTLNAEFSTSGLVQFAFRKPLRDLHSLLTDIESFIREEQARPFFKAIFTHDARLEGIDGFYRRIGTLADAFQISALLNIQRMLSNDKRALEQDTEGVEARLRTVEQNQLQLWQTLGPNRVAQPFVHSQAAFNNFPAYVYGHAYLNAGQVPVPNGFQSGTPYLWSGGGQPLGLQNVIQPLTLPHIHTYNNSMDSEAGAEPRRQRILFYPGQKDQYHSFNPRSPHRITYNGKKYPTAEHLYQAFRYMDNRPDIAEGVRTVSKSGTKAYKHSKAHVAQQHPDWDMMRTAKMEITLWHKFSQNTQLKRLLLGTGDAELVYYTTKDFWGVGKDQKGRNELGKALERARSGLREI